MRRVSASIVTVFAGCFLACLLGAPASAAEPAAKPAGADAATLAKANNPLADMNALNLQNYFAPTLNGVADATTNTLNLRGIMVAGRHIVRATLPVSTVPTGPSTTASGLGDFNIFDAIVVTGKDASTTLGLGPMLVAPTATDDALGTPDTWQAGLALVAVKPLAGGSLVGGLLTWQTDFAGGDKRVDTSLMTAQVFLTLSMGGGWYLRSSPLSVFDLENEVYFVPIGLGAGKVLPMGGTVVNAFVEPQVTVYHHGEGSPALQVFAGLNFQFSK